MSARSPKPGPKNQTRPTISICPIVALSVAIAGLSIPQDAPYAVAVIAQAQTTSTATPTPRAMAPRDVTGNWVSVITEDWLWRMVTPPKGDYASVPLNAEGRRAADAWNPTGDASAAEACKPFGAAAIMRVPGRLHITWEGDSTLRIDADAGTQTRRLMFDRSSLSGWRVNARGELEWFREGRDVPAPKGPHTWQGHSAARWELAPDPASVRALPFFPGGLGTGPDGAGKIIPGRYGSLHVVTTRMKAGYLRRNGVPYSDDARMAEYFDFRTEDDGTEWFTVTTIVEDPKYLSSPFVTSTDFRKEPDGSKWRPTTCAAY